MVLYMDSPYVDISSIEIGFSDYVFVCGIT